MYSTTLFLVPVLVSYTLARQVNITVDASKILGDLPPVARFFGTDEPNYATYPDGPHQTYFRMHNLLTTCDPLNDTSPHRLKWGCTNAYTEDVNGQPIYNFTIIDTIFDAYLENGVKPYVQTGFMPKALSSHPDPYSFDFNGTSDVNNIFTGWSNPPTSFQKRGELIYQWAKHCLERYREAEVESWYWEVWNEPNIAYWNGTQEQYFTLYDHAVNGVLRALPSVTVGGPEVAGGASRDWLSLFLDHTLNGQNDATGDKGAPLDFISFHAKGSPTFINATDSVPGHLQMNMASALQNVNDVFFVIQSFKTLNHLPVFIGEDDPDSCAACLSANVDYRNGLIYPSYTAAAFTRELDLAGNYSINLTGALTWAFEFDDHPYFDGFRVLATNQIDKPILNIFRMFGKMQTKRLEAQSTGQYDLDSVVSSSVRGDSDVGILASISDEGNKMAMLVWNYHDDALPKPDAQIFFTISNGFMGHQVVNLTHYRIDQSHSNAYSTWLALGLPQDPTPKQLADLKAAGMLQMLHSPTQMKLEDGMAVIQFDLPIHAVSLLVVEQ
ncbi:xylan 1,4-beta-xylosidase [Dendrothele bispora CBS 962.96]|uniref:Xylan 1,4-beta-xylosidase n=1 Tax=Dendrothele bispora (strain CBS 962.96) TaxID=1314807 RepID=A0A4V4HC05_DENBC|nr:xylan 1,4-beta-xylosidase [Dendrothele bispora CBS 962.96]